MNLRYIGFLAAKFEKMNKEEVISYIEKLGWSLLGSGGFKVVFHKKGVPFVIKLTRRSNDSFCDRSCYEEMGAVGPKGLPPIAWGETKDEFMYGFQKMTRNIEEARKPYTKNGGWKKWYLVFIDNLYRLGHRDVGSNNLGVDEYGRIVQFD